MTQPFKIIFPKAYAVELQPEGELPVPGASEFVLDWQPHDERKEIL